MGHTKPADLLDLKKELAAIGRLEGLQEKSPNVFYLKSVPFLHFHDKDGIRWADVKTVGSDWKRIEINFGATSTTRAQFLKAACAAHAALILKPKRL